MPDEEKKAIELLEELNWSYFDMSESASIPYLQARDTVLNLIQTQQAELEKKDRTIQQLKDENRTLNRQAQKYFEQGVKKDKIIDLMATYIATLDIEEDICEKTKNEHCDKMSFGECEDCIKQYYERKVEEDK